MLPTFAQPREQLIVRHNLLYLSHLLLMGKTSATTPRRTPISPIRRFPWPSFGVTMRYFGATQKRISTKQCCSLTASDSDNFMSRPWPMPATTELVVRTTGCMIYDSASLGLVHRFTKGEQVRLTVSFARRAPAAIINCGEAAKILYGACCGQSREGARVRHHQRLLVS